MDCQRDWIGSVHIPGWRIKPDHMKACEDFMANDAKVDEILKRHFATDDFVSVVKEYMKHHPRNIDNTYPYRGRQMTR
jgi:hypothetical protein